MYKSRFNILIACICMVFFLLTNSLTAFCTSKEKKFTIVIDAGHGGRDPGALGAISKEKDINLAIALKLGNKISENFSDVKVLYTRKNDTYLTVSERVTFVHKNQADLFISIHTNAVNNTTVYGAETFVLGLHKMDSNLEVAMRENSVIMLEDDYQEKYQGFEPNSIDSYIMFEFMQDRYLDNSLSFASFIQNHFTNTCKRNNRGVKQAGFWVLHKTACPSVLTELGFITNKAEELYMNSEKGREELANALYIAFGEYKKEIDSKSNLVQLAQKTTSQSAPIINPKKSEETASALLQDKPIYKIQIFSVTQELKTNDPKFKGLKNTAYYIENKLYKYTVGNDTDFKGIETLHKEVKTKFPDAFIIAFYQEKKISIKEAQNIQNQTK